MILAIAIRLELQKAKERGLTGHVCYESLYGWALISWWRCGLIP